MSDARMPEAGLRFVALRRELRWTLCFVGWVGSAWLLSALCAPAAHGLLSRLLEDPPSFSRVVRRVAMLVALVGFWIWIRAGRGRQPENSTRPEGASGPWHPFGLPSGVGGASRFARALALGAGLTALALGVEVLLGTWYYYPRTSLDGWLDATVGALVIGLVEEGVLRGHLLLTRPPLSGAATAFRVTVISLLYAALHFLKGGKAEPEVSTWAGFEVWNRVGPGIAARPGIFLGLFCMGLLFAAIALRDRDVWGAAGLHAGFVAGIGLGSEFFRRVEESQPLFIQWGAQPGLGTAALMLLAASWLAARSRRRLSGNGAFVLEQRGERRDLREASDA